MRSDWRDEHQTEPTKPASVDVGGTVAAADALALRPPALVLSLVAILIGALLVACGIAIVAIVILVARVGRDGASDALLQIQFDLPLRTRLSAATISALYLGLAATTLASAHLVGRRRWRALVALSPWRPAGWDIVAIPAVTLAYAVGATFAMARLKSHTVVVDGPTDYLLAGTIVTNLALLAPIAEELLFRGWLYTALRARFRFIWSFLTTAALFAAMHWDANHRHMLLVLPLAAALGLLRETTGSIKPTVILHSVYNLVIIVITLAET